MDQASGRHDPPAEGFCDALMSEAYPEDRYFSAQPPDQIHGYAGASGPAGSWRNQDPLRGAVPDLIDPDPIVPLDLQVGPEGTQRLHQVVGERVVVVDQEDHS